MIQEQAKTKEELVYINQYGLYDPEDPRYDVGDCWNVEATRSRCLYIIAPINNLDMHVVHLDDRQLTVRCY